MNSTQIRHLTEAYQEVYPENSPIFIHEEIELLSDEQLDIVIEGAVIELLEEGYTLEDINEAFEDFDESLITEARPANRSKNPETPEQVKAKQKDRDAKKNAGKPLSKKAQREATMRAARLAGASKPPSSPKTTKSPKTTDSDHSDAVRRSKTADLGRALASSSRVKKSVSKVTGNVGASGEYKPRATDRPNTPISSLSPKKKGIRINNIRKRVSGAISKAGDSFNKAAEKTGKSFASTGKQVKGGLKSMIKKGARKVARGALGVAKRMSEEYDQYDLVLEFLLDNQIAEDLQEAQLLMVNEVDSEDIDTILEAYGLT